MEILSINRGDISFGIIQHVWQVKVRKERSLPYQGKAYLGRSVRDQFLDSNGTQLMDLAEYSLDLCSFWPSQRCSSQRTLSNTSNENISGIPRQRERGWRFSFFRALGQSSSLRYTADSIALGNTSTRCFTL